MVLLFTETNERSCINFYPSISQNLEREKSEKSEKGKRLNLAKGGTLYPPRAYLNLNIDRNSERFSKPPIFSKRMGADNYRISVATNKDYGFFIRNRFYLFRFGRCCDILFLL